MEGLTLNVGEDGEIKDKALLEEFMKLYGGSQLPNDSVQEKPNYKVVEPNAQFCIKTKQGNGEKIFLNICTADHIPAPNEISEAELLQLLDSEDPSKFRVPMSLGEPHAEIDKSGKGCTAYDIVIHRSFCDKITSNNLFMGFFMSVIMEGLDSKYDAKLSREWVKLKNKKCMGTIQQQHIRAESKPWIMEMDPSSTTVPSGATLQSQQKESLIKEVKEPTVKSVEPKYKIVREPVQGHPEFLIAEVDLPEIRSSQALDLDIGEDCIMLNSRSKLYKLCVYLPYNLVQAECGAQFDKKSKKLTLTLPVVPLDGATNT